MSDWLDEIYNKPRCRVCNGRVRVRTDDTAGKHQGDDGLRCPGQGRPIAGLPPCGETCVTIGTMGYPVPYEPTRPHRSTVVCDSPRHQKEASDWVEQGTGRPGIFREFARG